MIQEYTTYTEKLQKYLKVNVFKIVIIICVVVFLQFYYIKCLKKLK